MATYRSITALKDSIAPTGLGANYSTQGKLSTFPFLVNGKTIETSIEIDSSGGRNNVSLIGPDGQTLAYYDKTSNKWSAPGSQGNQTITKIIIPQITPTLANAMSQSAYFTTLNANGGNSTQATQLTGIKPSTPTPTVAPPAGGLNPNSPGNQPTGDILFDLPKPDDLPFKFGAVDDIIKKMKNPLNYPEHALYNNTQDHLSIAQYSYKPPRSNDIFGDALDTLKTGSKRTSPLKELLGMVNLPMPNNITDSNNVSWGDDNMNNLSAALTSYVAKNAMLTGTGALALNAGASAAGVGGGAAQTASLVMALNNMGALDNQTAEMKTLLGGAINSRILGMLGVSVSPESILARGYGIVPNSNLELLFNAPTLREFTFQYRMSPRSDSEAKIVNNIIRFFKQGMAAKKQNGRSGAQSYFLGTPNVFQLQYKTTGGKTIKGVNRIKTCALTGFAMNYAADGNWAAYDDGQPVSVIMNMSFKELEPIYDTDYQEDIFGGRKFVDNTKNSGDLYPITPDEVGY